MEFTAFPSIKRFSNSQFSITQKIHGTNAQIAVVPIHVEGSERVTDYVVRAGSRNRWLYPHDDNFGFAAFVETNRSEIIDRLGPGIHHGEWAGPGINSGEGLTQKTFVLFDWWKYPEESPLPPQTTVVPVLYQGEIDLQQIDDAMEYLRLNGSRLVTGFMRPEGIVIQLNGTRYKKVFDAEETQWKQGSGVKSSNPKTAVDFSHLCQPIRLEKLLSRDERYLKNYPTSLQDIVRDYVADLIKEEQIPGTEDEIKSITKSASGQIFKFIKTIVGKMEYVA